MPTMPPRYLLALALLAAASVAHAQHQYAYPMQNQSPDQQKKDGYECHLWAVEQTGFDPSVSPPQQQAPKPAPQNHPLPAIGLRGQMRQAMMDEMMAEQQKMKAAQQKPTPQQQQQMMAQQQAFSDYQRARAACLSARGYSVR